VGTAGKRALKIKTIGGRYAVRYEVTGTSSLAETRQREGWKIRGRGGEKLFSNNCLASSRGKGGGDGGEKILRKRVIKGGWEELEMGKRE